MHPSIVSALAAGAPPMLAAMLAQLGLHEVEGKGSNPVIMQMARRVAGSHPKLDWVGGFYEDDDIPWCGLAVADAACRAGLTPVLPNPLSARAWADWGSPLVGPRRGAVVVFSRQGGGHVGIIAAITPGAKRLLVAGGNQSNAITLAWFDNIPTVRGGRVLGFRAPPGGALPEAPVVADDGRPVSRSEA
ncbi:TIGR02594 family protein [Prosthecodimorpha staleyi]|uniref:TIGR02594 family protein n=1 Tax=Prosthecodimorpha staleyi TaxID=2840188 RepID=A0A947DC71_9HYPH|nr:TIGR02594 family protein [Prosthecodimorpha staleyi]MBT9293322.1 TIGR02594 family protein [Prosthecodimorpha staleyi]